MNIPTEVSLEGYAPGSIDSATQVSDIQALRCIMATILYYDFKYKDAMNRDEGILEPIFTLVDSIIKESLR